MDEQLGDVDATRLGDAYGRGPEMLKEQSAQVSLPNAEAVGQSLDIAIIERAGLDQANRPRHCVRGAPPGAQPWGRFWPTSETGPEAGRLGCGGGRIIAAIHRLRRTGRTDRPAVDPGGQDASEKSSVEAGVTGQDRLSALDGI
jgi:hypothetical protein